MICKLVLHRVSVDSANDTEARHFDVSIVADGGKSVDCNYQRI